MKKLVVIIVAVLVIAGGAYVLLRNNNKNKTTGSNNVASTSSYTALDACNVLTNGLATQVLGSTAVKGTTPADNESTGDIAFSNCMYSTEPSVDPPHVVSVAVRSAKDSAGASSNKSVFTKAGEPADAQAVTGYGDSAYWDPGMGQLNVLKGNNWYILTNYIGTAPTNGTATLAMGEQLTQAVKL